MPSTVVVNGLGLTYKGTVGLSTATIPDVCKTPSPGGPVPIPYPNFADQSTLQNGTTTVTCQGQMIAIKGSEYSVSNGDEPGTAGGVTSSTFKKETAWITYSFDVFMDGANACRHTDKKFHNHKNTVDLAGNIDPTAPVPNNEKDIKCAIHQCDNASYDVSSYPADERCKILGTMKHTCVANHKKVKDKEPGIYSETFVDMTCDPPNVLESGGKGVHNFFQAANTIGDLATYTPGELRRPDLIYKDKNGNRVVADAKFPCPSNSTLAKKGKHKMTSPSSSASMLTGDQKDDYKLIQGNGKDPQEIQPDDCSASDCK